MSRIEQHRKVIFLVNPNCNSMIEAEKIAYDLRSMNDYIYMELYIWKVYFSYYNKVYFYTEKNLLIWLNMVGSISLV